MLCMVPYSAGEIFERLNFRKHFSQYDLKYFQKSSKQLMHENIWLTASYLAILKKIFLKIGLKFLKIKPFKISRYMV